MILIQELRDYSPLDAHVPSQIVAYECPINNLHLHSLFWLRSKLRHPVRADSAPPPLLRRRCVGVRPLAHDPRVLQHRALLQGHKPHHVVREREVEHAEARAMRLVIRRAHNAVYSRAVVSAAERLERVARVDDLR